MSDLVGLADAYLAQYLEKIERATSPLPDEALWWRPNRRSNSIANLILHLRGNLSMWVLAGLAGEPFRRHRSAEFSAREATPRTELVAMLGATVNRCRDAIRNLPAAELDRERVIQGYAVDGRAALLHAVEHMSYHTGQIVLLAKQLLSPDVELEFYPQHRLE